MTIFGHFFACGANCCLALESAKQPITTACIPTEGEFAIDLAEYFCWEESH